jgi:hypothetical protein
VRVVVQAAEGEEAKDAQAAHDAKRTLVPEAAWPRRVESDRKRALLGRRLLVPILRQRELVIRDHAACLVEQEVSLDPDDPKGGPLPVLLFPLPKGRHARHAIDPHAALNLVLRHVLRIDVKCDPEFGLDVEGVEEGAVSSRRVGDPQHPSAGCQVPFEGLSDGLRKGGGFVRDDEQVRSGQPAKPLDGPGGVAEHLPAVVRLQATLRALVQLPGQSRDPHPVLELFPEHPLDLRGAVRRQRDSGARKRRVEPQCQADRD